MQWVAWEGIEVRGEDGQSVKKPGFSPEKVADVIKSGGKLRIAGLLRVKVRHVTDGAVIGSREFVDAVFTASRERFGPKRQTGARPLRKLAGDDQLFAIRDLKG